MKIGLQNYYLVLIFTFIFSTNFTYSQTDDPTVVNVGEKKILKSQFISRDALTPQFGKEKKEQSENNKLKFLLTLIAEKLWALEAQKLGYDTTTAMQIVTDAFQKMFVRDKFYRDKILNKIEITDLELIRGTSRIKRNLKVNFLFSESKEEIDNLYKLLKNNVPFDSILIESPELEEQLEPINIVFGQMSQEIEDSLYKLKIGEITHPLQTSDGWYIFRLTDIEEVIVEDAQHNESLTNEARNRIKARKEILLFDKFFEELFQNIKVDVDGTLLKALTENLSDLFAKKRDKLNIPIAEKIHLEPADVIAIQNQIGVKNLNSNLIKFQSDPITLNKFLLLLSFDGFYSRATEVDSLFISLNDRVRSFIRNEIIAREGISRGYLKDPEVKRDIETWRDNYLFQMHRANILDTVKISEEEVIEFYIRYHKEISVPKQVKIIEILTSKLETVKKILSDVKSGKDFSLLAKKYNERENTKSTNGEYPFFPVTMYGEIGIAADKMAIGEVFGPIKLNEGYSVIKLIDVRESYIEKPAKTFEQVRGELLESLRKQKLEFYFNHQTAKLAQKFGFRIDGEVLNSIETSTLNTFGIRHLGFGGQITAAPLITPQSDWYEIYLELRNQIP